MYSKTSVTPERNLWATVIQANFEDALGIFKAYDREQNRKTLQKQYEKELRKAEKKYSNVRKRQHLYKNLNNYMQTLKARSFFESSAFDDIAMDIGYDSNFINKTFAYIQEAITLEKKLFDAVKLSERRTNKEDRRQKKERTFIERFSVLLDPDPTKLESEQIFVFKNDRRTAKKDRRRA